MESFVGLESRIKWFAERVVGVECLSVEIPNDESPIIVEVECFENCAPNDVALSLAESVVSKCFKIQVVDMAMKDRVVKSDVMSGRSSVFSSRSRSRKADIEQLVIPQRDTIKQFKVGDLVVPNYCPTADFYGQIVDINLKELKVYVDYSGTILQQDPNEIRVVLKQKLMELISKVPVGKIAKRIVKEIE